jgi:hypothetical protein
MLDRLMTEAEAAQKLRKTIKTLQTWRSKRRGPPYLKVGVHVFYDPARVEEWLRLFKREWTVDFLIESGQSTF